MLSLLFCFSFSKEESETPYFSLRDLIIGDWNIYPIDYSDKQNDEDPPYSIEFHTDLVSQQLVGSAWSNQGKAQDLKIHQIDEAELAQFVIFMDSEISGKVLDLQKPGKNITSFLIRVNQFGGFKTEGTLDEKHSFTLNYFNSSDIRMYISESGKSSITEYIITKQESLKDEPFFGKYQKLAYILGGVFVVQLLLLICCMCTKKKLDQKVDEIDGRTLKSIKQKTD